MKKTFSILAAALTVFAAASCQKTPYSLPGDDGQVTFTVAGELNVSVTTKAGVTPVTSLSGFNVYATSGSAGAETSEWGQVPFSLEEGTNVYKGGKYWPNTEVSYHFYASNADIAFAADGCTVEGDGTSDIVCAYNPSPVYGTQNSLAFEHIFARIGKVIINPQEGYDISDIKVNITCPTAGKFNIRTGAGKTDGTGWTKGDASDHLLAYGDNDLYVLPGTYRISVSYSLKRDAWSDSFEKSATVDIVGGKINNIIGTAIGGKASDISFNISVADWGNNDINTTWDAQ